MKSPAELKARLRRQWESADTREARLLRAGESWPVVLPIVKPKPAEVRNNLDAVKMHVESWRKVSLGEVRWDSVQYRATSEPVEVPVAWNIRRPTEWLKASSDDSMQHEFDYLSLLVEKCDSSFHSLLIRRRSLWRGKPNAEVCLAAKLATVLEPGIADGQPLRTLSIEGIDTKFFERNSRLVTALLDVRFDGEVSKLGLETFLGAYIEGSHWLLVVDLDGSLLTFPKQRVASSDLANRSLPGERLLVVENEDCQHQLPRLEKTIAILGAGFDLGWMKNANLQSKSVGYWGDIDTWGLQFLSFARQCIPKLDALLMDESTFNDNIAAAVEEPVVAGAECPVGLTNCEAKLYTRLLNESKGRLEQEFLSSEQIENAILEWTTSKANNPHKG